ncbi:hypothetical protein [Streptomyces sp. NBC_01314]|uniref:hypothetical protein n=1 Tax=Streptomyces sp. NBC_01314 TaxID=2903821 RepID=UPI0030872390|nr:hypothetical protein OG622_10265 [Streptomyces sp. NBC_01314]
MRPPRRIMERAVEAYRAGRIGVRAVAIAALSGADSRATERELDEAGIRPPQAPPSGRVDVRALIVRRDEPRRTAKPPEDGQELR